MNRMVFSLALGVGLAVNAVPLMAQPSNFLELYRSWKNEDKKVVIAPASARTKIKTKVRTNFSGRKRAAALRLPHKHKSSEITVEEVVAGEDNNDPFEPVNRLIFGFNEILDQVVLQPVSYTYRTIIPTPVRKGVSNAVANAKAPIVLANDVLQGKPVRARKTVMRFLINSTVGLGGLVDAAKAGGIEPHSEDFGQTLGVWGVPAGPYVVAPVLGPSSPRHLVGRAVDTLANPLTWLLADFSLLERMTPTMADIVTGHESIMDDANALRKASPDFYSAVRGIYRQKRKDDIADGEVDLDDLPEIPVE